MAADLVEEIVIDQPMESVFQFLSNPVNRKEMYSIVSEVECISDGEISVGSRFREMRKFANRKVGTELEIIESVAPKLVVIKSEANGMNILYRYQLKEAIGGTRVTFEGIVEATKLKTKLMRPALVKMMKQEDGDHLLYVKKALEKKGE